MQVTFIMPVMENTAIRDLKKSGVTLKQYLIGRRDTDISTGTLNIGRYLALDMSMGSQVYMDALRPHVVLICGKRGYGKSYTMGTLIEELVSLAPEVKNNIAAFVVDTMGIFWTMRHGNKKENALLSRWELSPEGFDIDVYVPSGNVRHYNEMHIDIKPISISAAELSGHDWCSLFGVDSLSALGILLIKTITDMKENHGTYSLEKITDAIRRNQEEEKAIRNAALNYFQAAGSWGIFEEKGININDIIRGGAVSILDLSSLDNQNIRAIVVKILSKKIYDWRIKARRSYERIDMGDNSIEKGIPMVWMFIDEAQIFLPREGENPATSVLVNEWLRQGRQPGLSIVLSTQRPAALHSDVLSQSDIIICHRLTAQDDISSLESIRPTYMREGIGDSLRKMGMEKGVAFIIDDISEAAHVVRMRPRKSWHGGAEPSALGGR